MRTLIPIKHVILLQNLMNLKTQLLPRKTLGALQKRLSDYQMTMILNQSVDVKRIKTKKKG